MKKPSQGPAFDLGIAYNEGMGLLLIAWNGYTGHTRKKRALKGHEIGTEFWIDLLERREP